MKLEGKKTLSLEIMDEIEKMIRSGEIKPGDALPSERELSTKLGVSRPPIREAFHALRALGIIEIHAGGGAYLMEEIPVITEHFKTKVMLAKYSTVDVAEARTVIEKETVALAIKKATEKDIKEIKRCMDKSAKCNKDNVEEFLMYDFAFHKAIALASKNNVLAEMLETTRGLLFDINVLNVMEPGHCEQAVLMHEKIFNAIIEKDEPLAKHLITEHIKTITSGLDYFIKTSSMPL